MNIRKKKDVRMFVVGMIEFVGVQHGSKTFV